VTGWDIGQKFVTTRFKLREFLKFNIRKKSLYEAYVRPLFR